MKLTFVLRNCRFPLYQVIIAFGLDPALSHATSYRRSATSGVGGLTISTVNGFTRNENENMTIIFFNEVM